MAKKDLAAKEGYSGRPRCPNCGSSEVRFRIKAGDSWCRRCGHVFVISKK